MTKHTQCWKGTYPIVLLLYYFKIELFKRNHKWFNSYRFNFSTNGLNYHNDKVQNFIKKNLDHLSVTITIDGKQIESCGSTVLFVEEGLVPDVEFNTEEVDVSSDASGLGDLNIVAETVNKYKNYFGKPTVVVIQSQLGDPICAYSGDDVYWEVSDNLPKTTKLMIDGKALYIHRANFQIIDKGLLN